MARISHCSISVLILLLISVSSCFDSYYGTINAEDAMHWIQQSQAAGDWSDLTPHRFWNPNDLNIDPARRNGTDSFNDVHTPWKCNLNPGSLRIIAINLAPTGVETTWAQVRMAVLSVLSSNTEANRLSQLDGGSVYLESLAVVIYNTDSEFTSDLAAATLVPKGLSPASFHNKLGNLPQTAPQQQRKGPLTLPVGPPPINLAVPAPIGAGVIDCDSNAACPVGEICHVVVNDHSTSQGCVPYTTAMLGLAYDLASTFCVNAPKLCAMPAPPSTPPPLYTCGCNCTYVSNACCTADDGIVHESLPERQVMTPLSGSCCDALTGRFETRPEGEDNLNPDDGDYGRCRHEPLIGANNIGRIHYRRTRHAGRGELW